MNPVTPIDAKAAPTLENAKKWMLTMAERGEYARNTARFRVTAIDALVSVLGEEESRDPKAVFERLADLSARWARVNNSKAQTASEYESRARSLLRDYLAFLDDPTKFKPSNRPTAPKLPRQKKERVAEGAETNRGSSAGMPSTAPTAEPEGLRTFPVRPGGAVFAYRMPPEGLTMAEVVKIAFHLVTMANDFDPVGGQVPNFSIIQRNVSQQ